MEHDTLAKRLGLILTRLNTGERLTLADLSMEFNVTQRTLQRDFNERLNYLPIERDGSTYFIDVKYLGRQGKQDIKPILTMLGLSSIFPSFDALSFTRLNDNQVAPFLFRELKIEDVSSYEETFKLLTSAIQNNHFRNTNILPEQKLLKILDDDSLLVTSTITNQKQIIPILKYWLPDIEILSPVELKQSLLYELQFSIDQLSR